MKLDTWDWLESSFESSQKSHVNKVSFQSFKFFQNDACLTQHHLVKTDRDRFVITLSIISFDIFYLRSNLVWQNTASVYVNKYLVNVNISWTADFKNFNNNFQCHYEIKVEKKSLQH